MVKHFCCTDPTTGHQMSVVEFLGTNNTIRIVVALIVARQQFKLIPFPKDVWEIVVDKDDEPVLKTAVENMYLVILKRTGTSKEK